MHRALLILELAEKLRFLSAEHAQSIREALKPQHAQRFEHWVVEQNLMSRSLLRAVAAALVESHWRCTSCEAQLAGEQLRWHRDEVLCPHCDGDDLIICSRMIPPVPKPLALPPTVEEEEEVADGISAPRRPRSIQVRRRRAPMLRRAAARALHPLAAQQGTQGGSNHSDAAAAVATTSSSPPSAHTSSRRLPAPSGIDPSHGLPAGFMVRKWQVLRPVGRGGMGTVYLGYDEDLDELSAIKVLPFTTRRNPQRAISRFEREARAYAQLDHPNVVRMRDFVRFETFDCIVLEWCNGGSLAQRLRENGPMTGIAEIVELGRHVVAGLAHAHEAGLVHRDVKAENILWRRCTHGTTHWIKVADFGIVKELHTAHHLTAPGAVIGTPSNMAPEQVMGDPASPAVDVYALACVLYQAATGRQPYAGLNKAEVLCRHLDEPFPSLTERRPELPAQLERLLACMAAKRPNERPSLDEVDEELAALHGQSRRHVTTRRIYARRSPTPLPLARGMVVQRPPGGGGSDGGDGGGDAQADATSLMTLPESDEVALLEQPKWATLHGTSRDSTTAVRGRLHLTYGIELSEDGNTAILCSGGHVTAARGHRLAQAAQKATLLGVRGVVFDFVGCLYIDVPAQRTLMRTLKRLGHFRVYTALAGAPKCMRRIVEMHGLWPSVALCRTRAEAHETVRLAEAANAPRTFRKLP